MMRIFADLNQLMQALVPAWAMPYVLGVLALAAVPLWAESVRGRQIKGAIRRMVRADPDDRPILTSRALGLAGTRRGRLIGLIQEAIRYGQTDLVTQGLARLEAHPRGRADAAALRARVAPAPPRFRDPVEASVRIGRLVDQGLVVAADELLVHARSQFPSDPDLEVLQERLLVAQGTRDLGSD